MKTKSSSRSTKKKAVRPKTPTVRARAAKVASARPAPKKAVAPRAAASVKKAGAAPAAAKTDRAKYQQSGAPWWKQFL